MLKMHGLDPDKIKEELIKAQADRTDIEKNYETKLDGFKETWKEWVLQYKKVISKQKQSDEERSAKMNKVNPAFILRNYLMQEAIEKAESSSDFTMVNELLALAKKPFDSPKQPAMTKNPPKKAFTQCVSCSS